MRKRKSYMPFKDAMDLVPDDMPDGAYWAMAHEIAGLEYGAGFPELAEQEIYKRKIVTCSLCDKRFASQAAQQQHFQAKHGRAQPTPEQIAADVAALRMPKSTPLTPEEEAGWAHRGE